MPDEYDYEKILNLLFWFAFIGLVRSDGSETYIYNVNYDMKRFRALIRKADSSAKVFCINKAFWSGLEIRLSHGMSG